MTEYTVEVPDDRERGIRVECTEHGEREEFQPGYSTVPFYSEGCGTEIAVSVSVADDWKDMGEMC